MLNSTLTNVKPTRSVKLIALLLTVMTLQGCVIATVAVVATGASMATDRRSLGKQIDDQSIEFTAYNELTKNKAINDNTNIHLVSVNGSVLLVGQAPNSYLKGLVVKTVTAIDGVLKINDQIRIANNLSVTTQSNDIWLTSKVKTALFSDSGSSFNNIKVVTENSEVFLLGLVSKTEADIAVDITRKISGVNKVFKAFEYM